MKDKLGNGLKINGRNCVVFMDFDNTITVCDVIDDMLLHFSANDRWVGLEEDWKKGKIGSRECLQGQVKGIRITKDVLNKYLSGIKIDPYFRRLIEFLDSRKIKTVILSDNFDYILGRILDHHAGRRLTIYSNKLRFAKDRLIPLFPFRNSRCGECAHCKTKNLLANAGSKPIIIYVGDGKSDTCPAGCADIIFAKKDLLKYCVEKDLPFIKYDGLDQVYNYFKRSTA
jgi:2-hydroxy-3-keto-5-methylthiopentenyl-1-phosphate phosphatase